MVKTKNITKVLPDIDTAFYKINVDNKPQITLPSNDIFYEPFLSPKKLNPFARSFKPIMNINNVNNINNNKENMPIKNKCRVATPLIIKNPSTPIRPMITIYRPKVVTEQVLVIKPPRTPSPKSTTSGLRSSSPKSETKKKKNK
jgi:hypothetical protein